MEVNQFFSECHLFEENRGLALTKLGLSAYIKYMTKKYPFIKTTDYFEARRILFENLSIFELKMCQKAR